MIGINYPHQEGAPPLTWVPEHQGYKVPNWHYWLAFLLTLATSSEKHAQPIRTRASSPDMWMTTSKATPATNNHSLPASCVLPLRSTAPHLGLWFSAYTESQKMAPPSSQTFGSMLVPQLCLQAIPMCYQASCIWLEHYEIKPMGPIAMGPHLHILCSKACS